MDGLSLTRRSLCQNHCQSVERIACAPHSAARLESRTRDGTRDGACIRLRSGRACWRFRDLIPAHGESRAQVAQLRRARSGGRLQGPPTLGSCASRRFPPHCRLSQMEFYLLCLYLFYTLVTRTCFTRFSLFVFCGLFGRLLHADPSWWRRGLRWVLASAVKRGVRLVAIE